MCTAEHRPLSLLLLEQFLFDRGSSPCYRAIFFTCEPFQTFAYRPHARFEVNHIVFQTIHPRLEILALLRYVRDGGGLSSAAVQHYLNCVTEGKDLFTAIFSRKYCVDEINHAENIHVDFREERA